jgi:hypothetical protein
MSPAAKKPAGKRGPGRPATGKDPMVGSRVPADVVKALDAWAAANGITRSTAVARLIEAGLKRRPKS